MSEPQQEVHDRKRDIIARWIRKRNKFEKCNQVLPELGDSSLDGPEIYQLDVSSAGWFRMLDLHCVKLVRGSVDMTIGSDTEDDKPSLAAFSANSYLTRTASTKFSREKPVFRSIFGFPVISTLSQFWRRWFYCSLILDGTWTAIMVPITTAFYPNERGWGSWVNLVVGIFYILDLFINFQVTYLVNYQYQKFEVQNARYVAWHYIRHGTFVVDFLAAVATLGQIIVLIVHRNQQSGSRQDAVLILRMLRMLRVTKILKRLFLDSFSLEIKRLAKVFGSSGLYFVNLMYGGFILANFLACLWYWVAVLEGLEDSWVAEHLSDPMGSSISRRYLASFYYAIVTIATVGYGDITPTSAWEELTALLCIICGVLFYGFLLGSITELMGNASKKGARNQRVRDRMLTVNSWMHNMKLTKSTKKMVNHYYHSTWIQQKEEAENDIFQELPYHVRENVTYDILRPTLQNLDIFQCARSDADFLKAIAGRMTPLTVPRKLFIYREGEPAEGIYILQRGTVQSVSFGKLMSEEISGPAYFGTLALFSEDFEECGIRLTSFVAQTACRIWYLPTAEFRPLLHIYPEVLEQLADSLYQSAQSRVLAMPVRVKDTILESHDIVQKGGDIDYKGLHIPGDIYFSIKILHQHNPKLAVQLFRELDQNVSLTASNLAQKSVGVQPVSVCNPLYAGGRTHGKLASDRSAVVEKDGHGDNEDIISMASDISDHHDGAPTDDSAKISEVVVS